jgi:hypothetical protein
LEASEGRSSLLAHSVQAKVSPTYALPNASGRFSTGLRMLFAFVFSSDGYASDALGEMPSSCESGSGCCVASAGRDSLEMRSALSHDTQRMHEESKRGER